MRRFLLALVALFFLSNLSFGQEYVRLMEDKSSNFYDIQKAFNEYWDGKPYEKGKGWKQFKRWEYFMEPRVYPLGRIVDPSITYTEHKKFQDRFGYPKGYTQNKNSNWAPMGPTSWTSGNSGSPGLGRINAITIDPNNSSIIYIGSPAGGLWKSIDAGSTWAPLTDNLGSLGVSGIAIDPNNSNNVYIATGDGDGNDTYSIGVMKSTDAGATWNTTGLNWAVTQTEVMRRILIHPSNGDILWVGTSDGLWKTIDGGANWNQVLTGSIRDMELNPANPNTMFACTNTFLYKSTDGGDNFVGSSTGLPSSGVGRFSLAVTPDDTNYVYILATENNDNGFLGIYRSTNGGISFSVRATTPNILGWNTNGSDTGGQGWYDLALAVSPTNRDQIFTGGVNMWTSIDGGATMTCLTDWITPSGFGYVHADIHSIDYYGNTLYCGSDGGIFRSTNNGGNWTDLTIGIQHSQFYRLGGSATNGDLILTGSQDNGTFKHDNGSWNHVRGGDGMECIIDYSNPNIMYASVYYGNVAKSTNGGNSFNNITNSISGDEGAWVTPYVLDPVNPNTIYLGYHDIFKSTNGGNTWNAISSFAGASSIKLKSLVVAPSNNNYIYAASDPVMWKTTDGGSNWTNITAGLPNLNIKSITVNNLDPNIIWVCFSGYTAGEKVYKSIDGGANWTNVSGILPNIPMNCVLFENGTNNGVYVGTDMGVYYKDDDLNFWQAFMTNLPNVIVDELEIHYGSGKIRAATFGRGLWESDLFISNTPPIAQFSTPDTAICPGQCATFSNNTINLGQNWTWYFPGGTPSTSTDLNPTVCYPTAGNYDVSLVSSNSNGTDSAYTATYVNVQTPIAGSTPTITEDFQSTPTVPNNWNIINEDLAATWGATNSVGGFGASSSSIFIDNFSTPFVGEKDYFITHSLDFTSSTTPILTFDVAYNFWTNVRSDTLAIYYSNDCGVTKNLLWEKDGEILQTANNLPLFFTPAANEWRNDTVDLSPIVGMTAVDIYFENRSGNGNAMYIDNINIFEHTNTGISENELNNIVLYPNPFSNTITLRNNNNPIDNVEVYDAIGKLVYTENATSISKNHILNLNHLKQGFYMIKVLSGNNVVTKNIIKR